MAEQQLPATNEKPKHPLISGVTGSLENLMNTDRFEHAWRVAKLYSASEMVPVQFQNKPENCFIAFQMAARMNVDPFMFMQNCYIVHGRPGMESKLAIALAEANGAFYGPIQYKMEGEGKNRKCTAFAKDRTTHEVLSQTVTWEMVEKEGWNKKSGSKWLTMPDLMFHYRSAMFLIRVHAPWVLMGLKTVDELEDMGERTIDVQISRPDGKAVIASDMNARLQEELVETFADDANERLNAGEHQGGEEILAARVLKECGGDTEKAISRLDEIRQERVEQQAYDTAMSARNAIEILRATLAPEKPPEKPAPKKASKPKKVAPEPAQEPEFAAMANEEHMTDFHRLRGEAGMNVGESLRWLESEVGKKDIMLCSAVEADAVIGKLDVLAKSKEPAKQGELV